MNPLAIRIAADIEAFKANMEEMKLRLETNAKAMSRMSSAFDGTKVIENANAMVLAIGKIGGASVLTEAEQRRVNAAVTEAINKYQVLGREAPAELLALRDATNKVETATKQVEAPVESLTSRLKGLAGTLGIAFTGAAVVSGIKSLISNTFEYAETIKDTSAKLAISMEATQRFKFAAEQTGASLENVSKSILKLSQGVAGGDKGLKEALESAGVQFESLKGMKPEDAFNVVAEAIAKIPDPMTQADVALAAFGKSGAELLPALREGFVDIGREVKVMSDATINALDSAKDKWEEFSNKVTVATGGIVAKILGMMEKIAPSMQLLLTLAGQFDAANMWSVFVAGADKAKVSVDALTASQQSYVDALIKTFGIDAVKEFAKGDAAMTAYLKTLEKVPPVVDSAGASHTRAAKEVDKFRMSLPGVTEAVSVREFFDSLRVGADSFTVSLPGVTARMDDFVNSIRVGTDEIESYVMTLPGVAAQSAAGFVDSLEARNDDISSIGQRWAEGLAGAFSRALEGLGQIIVGAIQGGGNVAQAAFASIGQSLGSDLGRAIAQGIGGTLGQFLGSFAGPLGALLGQGLGGLFDRIFGNEGRDNIVSFANSRGGFDALRQQMLILGDEGERLWINLTQNARGPAQVQAAIQAIIEAFARQEEAARNAAQAVEDGANQEIDATLAVKKVMQDKIDVLDGQRESVFNSIRDELEAPEYDEAGNRIYGVIEAQGIARLAEIDRQKEELAAQMAEAASKVMDQAVIVRDGIEELFRNPISLIFDASQLDAILRGLPNGPGIGGGVIGGGLTPTGVGPGSFSIPSGPSTRTGTMTINVISQLDGRTVAQNQVKYIPSELDFIGARR